MQVIPIKTPIIKPSDNLAEVILTAISSEYLELLDGDVLAVASKVISIVNGRIVKLRSVKPSTEAVKLAEKHSLEPEFAELIIRESEKIYGGVKKAVLAMKYGIFTVNAGIDHKNAPQGYAALWPLNPQLEAEKLKKQIETATGKRIGVIIVDSSLSPLRLGTRGFALAVAGFKPVKDYRGERDLSGREILITVHSLADDLASAAHAVMGESSEQVPAALIRDAPITLDENVNSEEMRISSEECVYSAAFKF